MSRLKPGLHMVVTIAEHACDHVLKRVLKLFIYCSQTFLVKYKHLQLCEDKGILGKLSQKSVRNLVLAILTTYMETRLKSFSQQKWKGRCWTTLTRIIQGGGGGGGGGTLNVEVIGMLVGNFSAKTQKYTQILILNPLLRG